MKAINLRTEYLVNPVGIDIQHPRLMWICDGTGRRQTAYQIVTEKWDSGKVSSSSMHADYPQTLSDRERAFFRVPVMSHEISSKPRKISGKKCIFLSILSVSDPL